MCGINFIIDRKKALSSEYISRMSDQTVHRGPDETKNIILEGNFCSYHVASNRLKITDQSEAASQPFIDNDSKCALLFNGEIYNFHELKNELLNDKISFNSHSDTEVLFHWIRKYGVQGIGRLEGMFAFIFVNSKNDEVIIARDRFGIKPLYFSESDDRFIASSEIKPITASGLIKKELNEAQIPHYLLYKYAKSPETFYKDIYELEPGYCIKLHDKKIEKERFHNRQKKINKHNLELDNIEELIKCSLLQQLDSKVPLGLLLSGGVDSTLLLALANHEGFTLPTYSIVNSKSETSYGTKDYFYSRLASNLYNSEHHEIEIDISLLNQYHDFVKEIDQPIGDSSYLLTSAICKTASQSMKVLLSGAGADELFAGYNRHYAFYHYLNNKKLYDTFMPILRPLLSSLPTGISHPLRKQFRLTKKLSKSYNGSPSTTFHNYLTFNDLEIENQYQANENVSENLFDWSLSHDQNNYLVSDVLALSDNASMLHGIEMRVPYLNENLIEYLNNYSAEERIKNGPKWILKDLLKKYGGEKFTRRSKEGFGLPLASWLFDHRSEHLWESSHSGNSIIFNYLDKHKFDRIVSDLKKGANDHGPLLWSILLLSNWLDQNFE